MCDCVCQTHDLDGFDGVTWEKLGVQTSTDASTDVETATTDDDSNTMIIHLLTNPTSPRGKQHCQQLTVPGGKSSLFWQGEGWRYSNWVASA